MSDPIAPIKRLLIVGSSAVSSLEHSYVRAANAQGWQVEFFDPEKMMHPFIKGGKVGRLFHQFVPVDAWMRKMNRLLVFKVGEWKPDIVMVFTNVPVLYGTIATIKTIHHCAVVWIWPDTPMNLMPQNADACKLYDLSGIYSKAALPVFDKIGFNNAFWLPLAGDPVLHGNDPVKGDFDRDISFVGMWRPEREKAIVSLINHFPQLAIEVYGTYWKERCIDKSVRKYVKGNGLLGQALGRYFNRSRINLNVIDSTNYPAANMRFFEIPTAGGLQLSSTCPEQEGEFRHKEEVVYFSEEKQLLEGVEWMLQNPEKCTAIRINAHSKVHLGHTYSHRFKSILDMIHSHKQSI